MDKIKEFASNVWFWVRLVGFIAICGVVFGTIEMIADGDMDIKEFLSDNFSIVEEIEKEAYEKGFVDGRAEGREENVYENGRNYDSGYDDGYEAGFADGAKDSSSAYEDGYIDGYTKGYSEGKAAGTNSGTQSSGNSNSSGKSNGSGGGGGGNTYYGPVAEECDYVLNKSTKKFHKPSCSSATNIKPSNREYFTGTREAVIARGFDPCGRCDP